MITISNEEFEKRYGKITPTQPQGKTLGQKLGETVKSRFTDTLESVARLQSGEQGFGSTVLQTAGNIAGGLTEAAMQTVGAGVGEVARATGIAEPAKKLGLELLQTSIGQQALKALGSGVESYDKWKAKNPTIAENIEAVIDVASFIPVAKTAETAVKGTIAGAKALGTGLKTGAEVTGQALKTAGTGIGKGVEAVKSVTAPLSRIPSNIATNVATQQAKAQAVKSLPTKVARIAAQDGVDVEDLKFIYKIPKSVKPIGKELLETTKSFSSGAATKNPIEVVGRPIVQSIKYIEKKANEVGKKIGESVKNLKVLSTAELKTPVFDKLKSVPGLTGLTEKNGVLNFKNTVLSTAETASDRKAIQSIYNSAIKWGNAGKKHLLRQELFESLGGKKAGKVALTGTQEKAYEAIRSGLLNAISKADSTGNYAKLSTEYAKLMKPLSDMRKFMKNVAGAEDDILEMNAGLLARRLTSNAQSNPQIRNILRNIDKLTEGTTAVKTEALQDLYNILEKYYNITGKTSFKGGITAGVEASPSVKQAAAGIVRQFAGQSEEVTMKALESAIREALSL